MGKYCVKGHFINPSVVKGKELGIPNAFPIYFTYLANSQTPFWQTAKLPVGPTRSRAPHSGGVRTQGGFQMLNRILIYLI
jgi:hypothetical protein